MSQLNQATISSDKPLILANKIIANKGAIVGITIASSIIILWAISLFFAFSIDLDRLHPILIFFLVLWQTFLYTGLFITAHDAIHGVVYPPNIKINHAIGSIAVTLYAFFSYREFVTKHWLHHRHPASELDPDYHDGDRDDLFHWYIYFMKGYWQWDRLYFLLFMYSLLILTLHISLINAVLFWLIPSLLSSLQLFYFGTFLTHREPQGSYTNRHHANSTNFPVFWSFITCYHFGYHLEHHEYPYLPWWKLPKARSRE
ncbi:MAG: beta-carotene ketolase CrtW [Xenococcaceae cyanobacterium]